MGFFIEKVYRYVLVGKYRFELWIIIMAGVAAGASIFVNEIPKQVGTIDPYIYTAYSYDYEFLSNVFGGTYYSSRVFHIGYYAVMIGFLGEKWGLVIAKFLLLWLASGFTGIVACRVAAKEVGLISAFLFPFNSIVCNAISWDYVDGTGVCLFPVLIYFCISLNRWLGAFSAGVVFVCILNTYVFAGLLACSIIGVGLFLNQFIKNGSYSKTLFSSFSVICGGIVGYIFLLVLRSYLGASSVNFDIFGWKWLSDSIESKVLETWQEPVFSWVWKFGNHIIYAVITFFLSLRFVILGKSRMDLLIPLSLLACGGSMIFVHVYASAGVFTNSHVHSYLYPIVFLCACQVISKGISIGFRWAAVFPIGFVASLTRIPKDLEASAVILVLILFLGGVVIFNRNCGTWVKVSLFMLMIFGCRNSGSVGGKGTLFSKERSNLWMQEDVSWFDYELAHRGIMRSLISFVKMDAGEASQEFRFLYRSKLTREEPLNLDSIQSGFLWGYTRLMPWQAGGPAGVFPDVEQIALNEEKLDKVDIVYILEEGGKGAEIEQGKFFDKNFSLKGRAVLKSNGFELRVLSYRRLGKENSK